MGNKLRSVHACAQGKGHGCTEEDSGRDAKSGTCQCFEGVLGVVYLFVQMSFFKITDSTYISMYLTFQHLMSQN